MNSDPIVIESRIKIPYRWPAGRAGGLFLSALRDEGRLVGLRCPSCRKVFVPPRPRCLTCKVACEEPVTVGPEGVVTTWTRRGDTVFILVTLDGADTALLHLLAKSAEPQSGMRVRAVLAERRTGHIQDIQEFRPV